VAAKRTITLRLRIVGLRETLRAFDNLPKDATTELRAASLSIAGYLAVEIRLSAQQNAQSALMGPTIRALKDRVPVVVAGGNRRVGSNKVQAYKVLFGSEFGATVLKQYRAHNSSGYWFFETVNKNRDYIEHEYNEAADEIIKKWGS
jgi:hypothetical protein